MREMTFASTKGLKNVGNLKLHHSIFHYCFGILDRNYPANIRFQLLQPCEANGGRDIRFELTDACNYIMIKNIQLYCSFNVLRYLTALF
jgi:hypothetical protein